MQTSDPKAQQNITILTEKENIYSAEHMPPKKLCQFAFAKVVVKNKGVMHIPEMECFIVKGSNDACYAVK